MHGALLAFLLIALAVDPRLEESLRPVLLAWPK